MPDDPSVKIIVATHKKYRMPSDPMYLPLHVGAEGKKDDAGNELDLGYTKDNTGDNISDLNSSFCELTGLYWAWKNVHADYIGLVHYRRHFGLIRSKDPFERILTYDQLKPYLGTIKVFVPKKRKYYIETLYSHYAHTHYAEHLDLTRDIIEEKYPQYLNCFDRIMNCRSGYMFNMMIMTEKFFNEYCKWLFDILFELKNRVKRTDLSSFQARFYGRVSEIIFNVWLSYKIESTEININEVMELPYIFMERENWIKKGTGFLKAKLFHKKYKASL